MLSEMPCDSSTSRPASSSSSPNDSWISSLVASIPSEDMSLLFLSSAASKKVGTTSCSALAVALPCMRPTKACFCLALKLMWWRVPLCRLVRLLIR